MHPLAFERQLQVGELLLLSLFGKIVQIKGQVAMLVPYVEFDSVLCREWNNDTKVYLAPLYSKWPRVSVI